MFSPGPLVSSTNKTDRHDITEVLLEVALSTISQIIIRLFGDAYYSIKSTILPLPALFITLCSVY